MATGTEAETAEAQEGESTWALLCTEESEAEALEEVPEAVSEDSAVSEEARSEVAVPEADGKTLKIKDYGNNKAVQRSGNAGFRIRAV